jgi:hypothetical protein
MMNTCASDGMTQADRRTFLMGLGVAAATAAFGSWTSASAALPAAPAAPAIAVRTPAVFWNLGYLDWTGAAAPHVQPKRAMAASTHGDADPHSQLLGRI